MLKVNDFFNKIILYSFLIMLVVITSIAFKVNASESQNIADLLESPAVITDKALMSLQVAITQAGARTISVGERGIVLLSDDNGVSWRQAQYVPVSVTLTDVTFATPTHGWAVGHSGVIMHTYDGGERWSLQLDGNQAAAAIFKEAEQSKVNGDESADAALRNAKYLIKEGPDKPFLSVHFTNVNEGIAIGAYGLALHTKDSGKTWHSFVTQVPNKQGSHLYSISEKNGDVLIAGERGALFLKTSGQKSFEKIILPYRGSFFGALILIDNSLLVYGLRGNIWRSDASIKNWQEIDNKSFASITSGLILDNSGVLLSDESGQLFISDDNGNSFTALKARSKASITDFIVNKSNVITISGPRGIVNLLSEKQFSE